MDSPLTEMTAVITGASSGVGLQTAIQLARRGDYKKVVLGVRNIDKAVAVIPADISETVIFLQLDLSRFDSVERFVEDLKAKGVGSIDRLVLNAGIKDYMFKDRTKTVDGFDEIWQVNYLSHFYLAMLVQPLMGMNARIVCLSSVMHWIGETSRFTEMVRPATAGFKYYSDSKLAMGILAFELDRRRGKRNVLAIAANPGAVASDLWKTWFSGLIGPIVHAIFRIVLLTTADGAKTSVYACTSADIEHCEYLSPYGQIKGMGWVFAFLSDLYWHKVASKEKALIGECSRDTKSIRNGNSLWLLSLEALAMSGRSDRIQAIIDEYL